MTEPLTDEQLILLIQEKTPEELSERELNLLRERLRTSATVQEALLGQVHFESYMNTVLGQVQISPEKIIQQAESVSQKKQSRRWWFGITLLLVCGLGTGLWWLSNRQSLKLENSPDQDKTIANANEIDKSSVSEESTDAKPRQVAQLQPSKVGENPLDQPNENAKPDLLTNKSEAKPTETSTPEKSTEVQPKKEPDWKNKPWAMLMDDAIPLRPFAESRFEDPIASGHVHFNAEEFQEWFEKVKGKSFQATSRQDGKEWYTDFNGTTRLKAPWQESSVFRFSMYQMQQLQLHFRSGEEILTFHLITNKYPTIWGAWKSSHALLKKGELSQKNVLLTTDSGLHERMSFRTFDLRWQDGLLMMTCGDQRLLTAPLSDPPEDFYLEGRFRLNGFWAFRGGSVPQSKPNSRPIVFQTSEPAALSWFTDLNDGSSFLAGNMGEIQLESSRADSMNWVATPIDQSGFYEVIVKLKNYTPGTGFYLGNDLGEPLHRVAFFRNNNTQRTLLGILPPNASHWEISYNPNDVLTPDMGEEVWVRITPASGQIKLEVSPDGIHWGIFDHFANGYYTPPWSTLGLYALPHAETRHIELETVVVREFSSLNKLASKALVNLAVAEDSLLNSNYEEWLYDVTRNCPAGASLNEWRRACALAAILKGHSQFTPIFRDLLIEEGIELASSLQEGLIFLDEMARIGNLWAAHHGVYFINAYQQLGLKAEREWGIHALRPVMRALVSSPIWTSHRIKLDPFTVLDSLTKDSLLNLCVQQNWNEVHRTLFELRFWNQSGNYYHRQSYRQRESSHLAEWSKVMAAWSRSEDQGELISQTALSWKHPLITTLSKEGYNIMAEFNASLQSEAWRDCCEIIGTMSESGVEGLLPDPKDSRLRLSLLKAVANGMRTYPELQNAMRNQQGPLAKLRVRQAIASGRADEVETATVRYFGTEGAAIAHRWLGDRHSSAGRFDQAIEHYRKGSDTATGTERTMLLGLMRFAGAMSGEELGIPLQSPVSIGGKIYQPAEFETLIQSLKLQHRQTTDSQEVKRSSNSKAALDPHPYTLQRKANFEGEYGQRINGNSYRQTDWAAKQLSTVVNENMLFVHNRFQMTAWQLPAFKALWTAKLGGEQGNAHDWTFQKAQPLLTKDKVYVRRLTNKGFELACLGRSDGKVLWRSRANENVASDPVLIHRRLLAMTLSRAEQQTVQLHLVSFHPQTGDVLSDHIVARFRDVWRSQPPCNLTVSQENLICLIGGTIINCDLFGHPLWIREQVWTHPSKNPHWAYEFTEPPMLDGSRLYVMQPSVKGVFCVDVETGHEVWKRSIPHCLRLCYTDPNLKSDLLVVQTRDGFIGLSRKDGSVMWNHPATGILAGMICEEERFLYLSQKVLSPKKDSFTAMVWLNLSTGKETGFSFLEEPAEAKLLPLVGPIIRHNDQFYLFWGESGNSGRREIYQLIPDRNVIRKPMADAIHSRWRRSPVLKSHFLIGSVLPGWVPLGSEQFSARFPTTNLEENYENELHVVKTYSEQGRPFRMFREFQVPAEQPTELVGRIGLTPNETWECVVEIAGKEVHRETMDEKTAQHKWKNMMIDLAPYRGKRITVVVSQVSTSKKKFTGAWWKTLEIRPKQ